jgi:hypothetical protein
MRIHSTEKNILEQKTNQTESMSNIINRIFLICKTDKNFQLKEQTKEIENKLKNKRERIDKQNKLLEQANTIYKDINRRVNILHSENNDEKVKLIESLEG